MAFCYSSAINLTTTSQFSGAKDVAESKNTALGISAPAPRLLTVAVGLTRKVQIFLDLGIECSIYFGHVWLSALFHQIKMIFDESHNRFLTMRRQVDGILLGCIVKAAGHEARWPMLV